MSKTNNISCCFPVVGLGGAKPEVRSLSGYTIVDDLVEGESVHAISANSTASRIAAGTKTGKLLVLERAAEPQFVLSKTLEQGAPILAVHWHGQDSLISSDTSSRLLVWQSLSVSPKVVPTPGPVCALVSADTVLVGLTIAGVILLWPNGLEAQPLDFKAPVPPKPFAWARGVYWPASKSILYPASGGSLTRFDMTSRRVTTYPAHEGEFYALQELEDGRLLTLGYRDRRACIWRPNPLSVALEMPAPPGVFAIMLTGDPDNPLAFICEENHVLHYTVDADRLISQGNSLDGDFRCGVGVSVDTHRNSVRQKRKERIDGLSQHLQAQIAAGDTTGAIEALNALRAEGCECLAVAFEAELAALSGDAPLELARRMTLCEQLPDEERSVPSFWRLAHLLVRLYLYPKAHEVLARIAAIVPDPEINRHIAQVERIANLTSAGHCALKVQKPTDVMRLIEVWNVARSSWQVRAVLQRWPGVDCRGVPVCADDLVRASHSRWAQDASKGSVAVETTELRVVSGWEIMDAREFVLFTTTQGGPVGVEVALQFEVQGAQVVAYPQLLFNPTTHGVVSEDSARHNTQCIAMLDALLHGGQSGHWIARTVQFAERLLSGVLSERLSDSRRRNRI